MSSLDFTQCEPVPEITIHLVKVEIKRRGPQKWVCRYNLRALDYRRSTRPDEMTRPKYKALKRKFIGQLTDHKLPGRRRFK